MMQKVLILLTALVLIALPARAQTKGNAKDQAAIKSIALKWQDAWNRHDMKALAALVADDVDFVNVAGRRLKNQKEFQEFHAARHEMQFKESVWTTKNTEIKFIKPDVALAHVEWAIKGRQRPGRHTAPAARGHIYVGVGKAKRKMVNHCGSEHQYQRTSAE